MERCESSKDCLRLKPMVAEMGLDKGVKRVPVVVHGQEQAMCRGESTMEQYGVDDDAKRLTGEHASPSRERVARAEPNGRVARGDPSLTPNQRASPCYTAWHLNYVCFFCRCEFQDNGTCIRACIWHAVALRALRIIGAITSVTRSRELMPRTRAHHANRYSSKQPHNIVTRYSLEVLRLELIDTPAQNGHPQAFSCRFMVYRRWPDALTAT